MVFLSGFRSDMRGTKAEHLAAWAEARGRAFLRFDYSGHGDSSGAFEDGTIGDWAEDGRHALDALTEGPQVLVGSSMGGWIALGTKKEDEWPFVAREFENRYRGYATRPSLGYPRWLPGIAEAQNSQAGQPVEPPVLIGDAVRAKLALQNGSDTQRIGFQQLSDREMQEALAPSSPRRLQA